MPSRSDRRRYTQGSGSGGGVALQPWQFQPETYGALGDGKVGTGGTGTSGQNVLTDAGASFTSTDVGKVIIINQGAAGAATNPFTGTITGVNSSTSVSLSGNLTANAASAPYIYGTDDVIAINNCITAAGNYGNANNNKAQVIFGSKYYMVRGITQNNGGVNNYNCHIPLPYGPQLGHKLQLELIGAGASPQAFYWDSEAPDLAGTAIVSAFTPPSQPDATFGQFSVIEAPISGSAGLPGGFFNALYVLNAITIVTPWNSQAGGMDCIQAAQMSVPEGRAVAFAPVNQSGATVGGVYLSSANIATNNVAFGFRFPTNANNAFNYAGRVTVEGFSVGIDTGEHFHGEFLTLLYLNRALQFSNFTGNPTHGINIGLMTAEICNFMIANINASVGATTPLTIGMLDMEGGTTHISDPNNVLNGTIYFSHLTAPHPVVSGGANLAVIDIAQKKMGPWAGAPAAPASATAQQNLAYRFANITLSGHTGITVVQIGPTAASLTTNNQIAASGVPIVIRVKPGWFYAVTYTGTLTTLWDLD